MALTAVASLGEVACRRRLRTLATISTCGFLKANKLSTPDLILQQIISDFEDLAELTQRAIDASECEDEQTDAFRKARDGALTGALLARKALGTDYLS